MPYSNGELTIEIIPSCKGGIILDGINDFGKVIGLPIYKDYTVAIEYERFNIGYIEGVGTATVISKSYLANQGAFLMNLISSNGKAIHSYSFGEVTINDFNDLTREIYYQSKYNNQGLNIAAGTGNDNDSLWLGIVRDNDSRFFNGVIYFLMVFPYSMSKFLIDRQLKKYKAGTLYKDMVQFRFIIKTNESYNDVVFYKINGSEWTRIYFGDFIPVGQMVSVTINLNLPYKITKAISSQLNNISIRKSSGTSNSFDIVGYIKDKTPQKLNLTIEVDENLVQFNPIINSNINYDIIEIWQADKPLYRPAIGTNETGTYLQKDSTIGIYVKPKGVDEVTKIVVNGTEYTNLKINSNGFYYVTLPITKSPQKIDITIDEYIRYEDIDFTDCYPGVPRIYVDDKSVTWGNKLKVGDKFTFYGNVNILPEMYNVLVKAKYNGEEMVYGSIGTITKSMAFTSFRTYTFDSNEPKCILSPSKLRIPNSSYKILGYIPDISGHGNHGVIHNSAYALNSGVNGYTEDFTKWTLYTGVKCTDSTISLDSSFNKQDQWILFKPKGSNINQFTINIKGIPDGGNLYLCLSTDSNIKLENGINEISSYTNVTNSTGFFIGANGLNLDWSNLVIEQVGEYEGAYCLDGVDDFITIPTTVGGKQVLMKVNWQNSPKLLYDQRGSGTFAILTTNEDDTTNSRIAYQSRNFGGKTYIDGIENNYIETYSLKLVTHNITITNPISGNVSPVIGCNTEKTRNFARMSLYDFMLFDEIDSDKEIINLNKYVGIEPKIEIPNWYYDVHGKTNEGNYKTQITEQVGFQKNGTSGNYIMNNYNLAYKGMSGYNGYPVVFGANETWNTLVNSQYTTNTTNTNINVTHVGYSGNGMLYSYVKQEEEIINIKEIPSFKVTIKGLEENIRVGYRYLATEDAKNETQIFLDNGTHELPKSFAPTEALLNLSRNAWIGLFIKDITEETTAFDCDITIEVLPEYPNGLAYDGVTDYSAAIRIPVFTDYTYILKRKLLDNVLDSCSLYKGSTYVNGGRAFISDYYNSDGKFTGYSFGNAVAYDINEDDLFVYGTKTSVNGNTVVPGSNEDEAGIIIGHWIDKYKQMVFYKLVLYIKTIPQLWIDFLRNLMAREEIIDITYPVFIQGTG